MSDILTATASYIDAEGPDKKEEDVAANAVAPDTRNEAPAFADQDDEMEGTQNTEAERTIAENAAAGTALNGGVVLATDPNAGDDADLHVERSLTRPPLTVGSVAVGVDETEGQITVGSRDEAGL